MNMRYVKTLLKALALSLAAGSALPTPMTAQAQEAGPAYQNTLKSLGATDAELAKLNQLYREAPPELKKTFDANDPKTLRNILDYFRSAWAAEAAHPLLATGAAMPAFSLKGVDGKTYTPESVKDAKLVAVMFISNHCPASQMYEDRLKRLVEEYRGKGVAFLAIQPDTPSAAAPSEHGFTDVDDTLDSMKIRSDFRRYNFPYLYDGERQAATSLFGAKTTPHFFLFDQNRKLRYQGRIDNHLVESKATTHEARDAIEALLAGKEVATPNAPVFGCSVKWHDRQQGAERERAEWAAKPVTVETASLDMLKALRNTPPGKIRIINFWATWCGPCKVEMPQLIETYQWYRGRDVDLVTVSVDAPQNRPAVLKFLKEIQAANTNLQIDTDDLFAAQAAFDPQWQSGVPFTIVLDADGKPIYREEGEVDILKLRRAILANQPSDGGYAGNADYWKR